MSNDTYAARGVDSGKKEVHAATANLDKGLFPDAFCKILPDLYAGSPFHCNIMHLDGTGTKPVLAYLMWKLTGDPSYFRGNAQDSVVMNLDDMGCAGMIGENHVVGCAIARNKALIPGEIVATVIDETQRLCDWFTELGIPCTFAGGETADVGNTTRLMSIDHTVSGRMLRADVIDTANVRPGDIIIGISSTGQAGYENVPNSGMRSNGLTDAIHDLLGPKYRKYRETIAPETPQELIYCGPHGLEDPLPDSEFTIAEALMSPTRTYLPLLKAIFEEVERGSIHAIIHNSGGGQTKIGKHGPKGVTYVKDMLPTPPPLFRHIMQVRGSTLETMFSTFNMGVGLDLVVPRETAQTIIDIARGLDLDAYITGHVSVAMPNGPRVVISHGKETCSYA